QLFRRHQRKALREIEPHLVSEHAKGSRPGPVSFPRAAMAHPRQQVEIILHASGLIRFTDPGSAGVSAPSRRNRERSKKGNYRAIVDAVTEDRHPQAASLPQQPAQHETDQKNLTEA